MNWKRGIGIGLIFVGVYIILTARVLTGAVVGSSPRNFLGILGVLILVAGMLMVLITETLERKVKERGGVQIEGKIVDAPVFFRRVEERSEGSETFLVLDTSAIRCYRPNMLEIFLKKYGRDRVLVPDSVLQELHEESKGYNEIESMELRKNEYFKELRRVVETNSSEQEGFEDYREDARSYLERTEKPILKKILEPYLEKLRNGTLKDISTAEMVKLQKICNRARIVLSQKMGLTDAESVKKIGNIREIIEDYVNELEVKDTDVDVLATAMCMADNKYKVLIGEKDIDLRQAVELIKAERPEMGENMDIVEVYEGEYRITEKRIRDLSGRLKRERDYATGFR